MKATTHPLVHQANELVRAPLSLTHLEARIFALALSCIHQTDSELSAIHIPFARIMYDGSGKIYDMVKKACRSLQRKQVLIERPVSPGSKKKVAESYIIISYLKISEGTRIVTGNFAPEIQPFLLDMAGQYTQVELESLLQLKSAHAYRMYWVLKSYASEGEWEADFEKLRDLFVGEKNEKTYPLYADFKRYVLDPSVAELHRLGWMVSYEPLKTGKKVTGVHFTIPEPPTTDKATSATEVPAEAKKPGKKQLPEPAAPAGNLPAGAPLDQRVNQRLSKLKMTKAQIKHVLDHLGDDEAMIAKLMKATHPLLSDYESKSKHFDNLGGAAINLLKTEFPALYPVFK